MISLSRLIKSTWVPQEFSNENKVISIRSVRSAKEAGGVEYHTYESQVERDRILQDAQAEASRIVEQARAQAARMSEQMEQERQIFEQELAQAHEQAKQAGYEAGYEEGKQGAFLEATTFIQEAQETVRLSKHDYLRKIDEAEGTILNIALQVADKIIGEALTGDPESFLPVVKKALKEAREYKEIQLHIHPNYYEFLLVQREDLIRIFPKETELYIFPDGDLNPQSCIIESANGRIDASVDTQLNELKRKLYELLESE